MTTITTPAATSTDRTLLFADMSMRSSGRGMLGRTSTGAADPGEVLTTFNRIDDGDSVSWVREWEATADRVAAIGDECLRRGHRVSARNAFLRAATYYAAAVLFVDGCADVDTVLKRTFAAHRRRWEGYLGLLDTPPERFEIPYEGGSMPGWFFAAAGAGPKPTLVMANGADGAISYLWPGYGSEATARGYNVVVFDGPGQQSMLFDRGIPFRHDWEHVITPVVDEVLRRPDVDPDRLALYGVSQGGYWVPRALAFEHRFAAAIADDGVVDVSEAWHTHLPAEVTALVASGDRDQFNAIVDLAPRAARRTLLWRVKPFGCPTVYDAFVEVQKYRITPELAAQITTPLLVADPDEEQYFTGQPERLYDMLPGGKELVRFTAAEGGAGHCQPMAKALGAQRFFDFLDERLGLSCAG